MAIVLNTKPYIAIQERQFRASRATFYDIYDELFLGITSFSFMHHVQHRRCMICENHEKLEAT